MCQVLAHLTLLNMTLWMCPDDVNLALPTTIFVPSPAQAPSPVQAPTRTPSPEPPPTQAPSPEPPPTQAPSPIRDRTPSPKNASTHGMLQSHRNNSRNETEPLPVQPQDLAWLHVLWCIPIMVLCIVLYHRRRAGSSSRILRLWAPKERDVVRTQSEPVKASEKVDNGIVRSVSEIQVIL